MEGKRSLMIRGSIDSHILRNKRFASCTFLMVSLFCTLSAEPQDELVPVENNETMKLYLIKGLLSSQSAIKDASFQISVITDWRDLPREERLKPNDEERAKVHQWIINSFDPLEEKPALPESIVPSRYEWAQSGSKIYYKLFNDRNQMTRQKEWFEARAYNGEFSRNFYSMSENQGTVRHELHHDYFNQLYNPSKFWLGLAMEPWEEFLTPDSTQLVGSSYVIDTKTYLLQGTVTHEWIFYIEGKPHNAFDQWNYSVWIAPDKGFLPLRVEMINVQGGYERTYEVVDTDMDNAGNWYPKELRFYKSTTKAVNTIHLMNVAINSGIPDELFELKWPVGTLAYDYELKSSYVVGTKQEHLASIQIWLKFVLGFAVVLILLGVVRTMRRKGLE